MDIVELLPCPFCGGDAERIDFGPGSGDNEGGSCIACTRCQSSGPVEFGYKENFVSNWNRRLAALAPAGVGEADTKRLDFMQSHRVALIPEFEGPWDAEVYQEGEVSRVFSGSTPREAIDEAIRYEN